MRDYLVLFGTATIAMTIAVNAFAISPFIAGARTGPGIQLVEDRRSETVGQKVKRIWRDLTGYKFNVSCPIFPIPLTHSRCTETGKNLEEARSKCQAQNPFCAVSEVGRS